MRQVSIRSAFVRVVFGAYVIAALLCACNGNTFVGPVAPFRTPAPTATPAQSAGASGVLTTSTTASSSLTLGPFGGSYFTEITAPLTNVAANVTIAASRTAPAGLPVVMAHLHPQNINGANINVFGYETWTPTSTVTFFGSLAIAWAFPPGTTPPDPAHSYVALSDPNNPTAGWTVLAGPASSSMGTIGGTAVNDTIFGWGFQNFALTLDAGATYDFVLFSTTSTLATPSPAPTRASPSPSPTTSVSPAPSSSASASPVPTASPTPSPTPAPTATPSPAPTPTPSPTASSGFEVQAATASGNGIVTIGQASGSEAAFAVEAENNTANNFPNGQIIVNVGTLALTAQICETNPSNGQCMSAPAGSPFPDSFTAGQTETFSVFLQSEGSPVNGPVTVTFEDNAGNVLGQATVTVQSTS